MIYITIAFYVEGKPIIDYFNLKKLNDSSKFQIFNKDEIFLIISGEGNINSAIATTYLLTKYGWKNEDIALNIGICGAKDGGFSKGDLILCNKIINHNSKRAFYPDILISHDMKEASLESFDFPVRKCHQEEIEGDIVDMEGAGFFEAASSFLYSHNIHCIKIVYDLLDFDKIDPKMVQEIIIKNIFKIENFINSLLTLNEKYLQRREDKKIKEILEKLKSNLHLTRSMEIELKKLLKIYLIRYKQIPEEIEEFVNIKVNSKKEGKEYFEKLKNFLTF
ncbi:MULTISPECIES: hypothetical protein [Dictyoglomus]|uniref:Nucleoside phosphorylase domain-containing protein n=1 Tax=Dictyoglomus turgidum (strain DSM 6724 / Z-1310) TaxID=515635 RepID=B8E1Y1_DICTD|nr:MULTISPECIES: hypothetical protein [Dictyoglomus]ACK41764.1 conserved hypothetical protein [Dictyoglomus turgidum DSM 6724]HBU31738.1 purine phosphorylase [Dictyoglomus sp.]